ncbi:MAG: peptidase signal peptidase [Frankiales bacterium]|nr:peptidase signal peptidase [Frankiales bacterium]
MTTGPGEERSGNSRRLPAELATPGWIEQLSAVWSQHQSLTAEAQLLRERLATVDEQLDLRREVMDSAQVLHEALLRSRQLTTDALPNLPTRLYPRPPAAGQGERELLALSSEPSQPAAAAAPEPSVLPALRPAEPVSGMGQQLDPDAAGAAATPGAATPARLWAAGRVALLIGKGVAVLAGVAVAATLLLVTVGPRFLPYQALVVLSGSMEPAIPTGSLVVYRKADASQIKRGDVIVFSKPSDPTERVTHRVYSIGSGPTGRYFTTKGDANGVPDNWRIPAVGSGWVAVQHLPGIGYGLGYLQSGTARLLLIVLPAVGLGLLTLVDIWKKDRGGRGQSEPAPKGPPAPGRVQAPQGRRARRHQSRTRRRQLPGAAGGLLLIVLTLGLGGGLVGGTFAAFSTETKNVGSTYSNSFLGAPTSITSLQPQGNDVVAGWGAGQNGDGYRLVGVNNASTANCPTATSTSYGQLTTVSGPGTVYTDANRVGATNPSAPTTNKAGQWFCYQVQTKFGAGWTSVNGNPTRAVHLGVVATSVALANNANNGKDGTGTNCPASNFGAANAVDCGDRITITYNQVIVGKTAVATTDTVCANSTNKIIGIGSTTTTNTTCAANEVLHVGALAGSAAIGASARLKATYVYSNVTDSVSGATVSQLVVTLGAKVKTGTASTSGTWTMRSGTPAVPTAATVRSTLPTAAPVDGCWDTANAMCTPTATGTF